MPPEQWKTTDVGPPADVWALGAMFAFLVTGQPSFPGQRRGQPDFDYLKETAKLIQDHDFPSWRAQRPELREEVQALFERCVQRDPAARFVDARALLKELRKLAVEDEDVLLDPMTGSGVRRAGTVTPPPKQTLLRIKAQIETIAMGRASEPEPLGGLAPRTEGPTVPGVERTAVVLQPVPSRRPWAVGLAAVLVLGVGLLGYAAGWFVPNDAKEGAGIQRTKDGAVVQSNDAGKPAAAPEVAAPQVPAAEVPPPTDPKAEALPLAGQLDAAAFADKIETVIGLTMFRLVPKPFTMGSPGNTGDETPHQVTISKPYWIGETEVTQGQWKAVMWAKSWGGDYEKVGDRYPATQVSWTDAVAFCAELTKRERAAGRLPPGHEYTLPSEAEWEYACRGGSTTAYCYGDDERRLAEYAVFGTGVKAGNSAEPVRRKKANAFGLYDMHGNVWEWCADYADYDSGVKTDCYRDGVTDPLCLSGALRVSRGGCWDDGPAVCRSALRGAGDPSDASYFLGFRPVLVDRPPVK